MHTYKGPKNSKPGSYKIYENEEDDDDLELKSLNDKNNAGKRIVRHNFDVKELLNANRLHPFFANSYEPYRYVNVGMSECKNEIACLLAEPCHANWLSQ